MKKNYKKFYALLKQVPTGGNSPAEIKERLVDNFTNGRTTSLRAMHTAEYNQMLNSLENIGGNGSSHNESKNDVWRKRAIASVFGYLAKVNRRKYDIGYVKAIILRCAGVEYTSFNKIPNSRLRAIYNEFRRQQETLKNVDCEMSNLNKGLNEICGIEVGTAIFTTKGEC